MGEARAGWTDLLYGLVSENRALVVEPVGEPCRRRECRTGFFQVGPKVFRKDCYYRPANVVDEHEEVEMSWDDVVLPVRLVRIREWLKAQYGEVGHALPD